MSKNIFNHWNNHSSLNGNSYANSAQNSIEFRILAVTSLNYQYFLLFAFFMVNRVLISFFFARSSRIYYSQFPFWRILVSVLDLQIQSPTKLQKYISQYVSLILFHFILRNLLALYFTFFDNFIIFVVHNISHNWIKFWPPRF